MPTPQLPNGPAGSANAAEFNHRPVRGLVEEPDLAFPTQSGLMLKLPVPWGSIPKFCIGVPLWFVSVYFNFHLACAPLVFSLFSWTFSALAMECHDIIF